MKGAANPRKLRVGVDARDLLVLEPTGVERVVAHFIEHVVAAADIEIVLFSDHPLGDRAPRSANHEQVVEPVRHPQLQRLFDHWILVQLRPVLRRHRVDAFYSLNTKFPLATVPSSATVYDSVNPSGASFTAATLIVTVVTFPIVVPSNGR